MQVYSKAEVHVPVKLCLYYVFLCVEEIKRRTRGKWQLFLCKGVNGGGVSVILNDLEQNKYVAFKITSKILQKHFYA